jgi:hypothetical protein
MSILVYFLRKTGTKEYYLRRGGRKNHVGVKRGTREPKYGEMSSAAVWTSVQGPNAAKRQCSGDDVEVVAFYLETGREIVLS